MPAFANFAKLHIIKSSFFQILQSKFRSSHSTRRELSERRLQHPPCGTIGSPSPRKSAQPLCYELADADILNTKYTVGDGKDVRTRSSQTIALIGIEPKHPDNWTLAQK
ncbi:hypothetical protein F4806DRAFT_470423 [Annulohypoxylon nitens]|nr:hypothetical protein F4806DRAFT_470423 [Annulohypoxylon nitens]